jgi:hypothetical protein
MAWKTLKNTQIDTNPHEALKELYQFLIEFHVMVSHLMGFGSHL